ncbi:hypothetical protein IWQ60_000902 [Tieghemiomyces parasiticus]|uniref:Uncharacterized protein n=1 Tax=Tieghemiomyces parasiticus TaxID=78921 RepID=A0A9W8AI07_9FUNG|nr:hypothetical protein IWQ60_000902 [Tieghemiomyces parasiticus]
MAVSTGPPADAKPSSFSFLSPNAPEFRPTFGPRSRNTTPIGQSATSPVVGFPRLPATPPTNHHDLPPAVSLFASISPATQPPLAKSHSQPGPGYAWKNTSTATPVRPAISRTPSHTAYAAASPPLGPRGRHLVTVDVELHTRAVQRLSVYEHDDVAELARRLVADHRVPEPALCTERLAGRLRKVQAQARLGTRILFGES